MKLSQERTRYLNAYLKKGFFPRGNSEIPTITFEASIHYYHHKLARDNLRELLPCSKLIWVLRNPLPRAVSEYLHQAVKKDAYPSFQSLVSAEIAAIQKCRGQLDIQMNSGFENNFFRCLGKFKLTKFMLSTGFYCYFINAWLEKFPRKQHYFVDYEVFRRDPQQTIEGISTFLGLDPPPKLNYTWKYNKANTRNSLAMRKRSNIKLSSSLERKIFREVTPFINKMYDIVEQEYNWVVTSLV